MLAPRISPEKLKAELLGVLGEHLMPPARSWGCWAGEGLREQVGAAERVAPGAVLCSSGSGHFFSTRFE